MLPQHVWWSCEAHPLRVSEQASKSEGEREERERRRKREREAEIDKTEIESNALAAYLRLWNRKPSRAPQLS